METGMAVRQKFFSNIWGNPAPSPQPTGYRITRIFQHQSCDAGHEEEPTEQTIDIIDVDSWADVTLTMDTLMLHTGNGFTVSLTVDILTDAAHETTEWCDVCGEEISDDILHGCGMDRGVWS